MVELATDAWAPKTEAAGPSMVDFLVTAAAVVDGGADSKKLKPILETLLESDVEALPIKAAAELAVLGTKSAAIAPILERLDVLGLRRAHKEGDRLGLLFSPSRISLLLEHPP